MKYSEIKSKPLPKIMFDGADYRAFTAWLIERGIETREGHDLKQVLQIKNGNQWCPIWWNKLNRKYTIDSRLQSIVDEFKSKQTRSIR